MDYLPGYSRGAIDRCGDPLREFMRWDREDDDEVTAAYRTMIVFRESFQVPLSKTATGLRSMVRSELSISPGGPLPVSQRLKRTTQILGKLVRYEEMNLSRMGDIGGVRAVLPGDRELDGVVRRIRKNWKIKGKVNDMRHEPRVSGYRALHIIVERESRLIEVQLRTPKQHEWALAVERTGQRLGIGLKEGQGPADLKKYFRLAAHGLYLEETGSHPDDEFTEQFRRARSAVASYFSQ